MRHLISLCVLRVVMRTMLTVFITTTVVVGGKKFLVLQREDATKVPTGAWHPSHAGMHKILMEVDADLPVNMKVKSWHVFDLFTATKSPPTQATPQTSRFLVLKQIFNQATMQRDIVDTVISNDHAGGSGSRSKEITLHEDDGGEYTWTEINDASAKSNPLTKLLLDSYNANGNDLGAMLSLGTFHKNSIAVKKFFAPKTTTAKASSNGVKKKGSPDGVTKGARGDGRVVKTTPASSMALEIGASAETEPEDKNRILQFGFVYQNPKGQMSSNMLLMYFSFDDYVPQNYPYFTGEDPDWLDSRGASVDGLTDLTKAPRLSDVDVLSRRTYSKRKVNKRDYEHDERTTLAGVQNYEDVLLGRQGFEFCHVSKALEFRAEDIDKSQSSGDKNGAVKYSYVKKISRKVFNVKISDTGIQHILDGTGINPEADLTLEILEHKSIPGLKGPLKQISIVVEDGGNSYVQSKVDKDASIEGTVPAVYLDRNKKECSEEGNKLGTNSTSMDKLSSIIAVPVAGNKPVGTTDSTTDNTSTVKSASLYYQLCTANIVGSDGKTIGSDRKTLTDVEPKEFAKYIYDSLEEYIEHYGAGNQHYGMSFIFSITILVALIVSVYFFMVMTDEDFEESESESESDEEEDDEKAEEDDIRKHEPLADDVRATIAEKEREESGVLRCRGSAAASAAESSGVPQHDSLGEISDREFVSAVVADVSRKSSRKGAAIIFHDPNHSNPRCDSFKKFQLYYLVGYFFLVFANVIQGPLYFEIPVNLYGWSENEAIHNRHFHREFSIFEVGIGVVFGFFVGFFIDYWGRKNACVLYCGIFFLFFLTYHFNNFWILCFGQFLSGVGSRIRETGIETYMIHEHKRHGYNAEQLGSTFFWMFYLTFSAAILGGFVIWIVRAIFGREFKDLTEWMTNSSLGYHHVEDAGKKTTVLVKDGWLVGSKDDPHQMKWNGFYVGGTLNVFLFGSLMLLTGLIWIGRYWSNDKKKLTGGKLESDGMDALFDEERKVLLEAEAEADELAGRTTTLLLERGLGTSLGTGERSSEGSIYDDALDRERFVVNKTDHVHNKMGIACQIRKCFQWLSRDPRIILVGKAVSLFEGAFYLYTISIIGLFYEIDAKTNIPQSQHYINVEIIFIVCSSSSLIGGCLMKLLVQSWHRQYPHRITFMIMFLGAFGLGIATICSYIVKQTETNEETGEREDVVPESSERLYLPYSEDDHSFLVLSMQNTAYLGYIIFGMATGAYYPHIGRIKAEIVPDAFRTTMYNIFYIPTDLILCFICLLHLVGVRSLGDEALLLIAVILLLTSGIAMIAFDRLLHPMHYVDLGNESLINGAQKDGRDEKLIGETEADGDHDENAMEETEGLLTGVNPHEGDSVNTDIERAESTLRPRSKGPIE